MAELATTLSTNLPLESKQEMLQENNPNTSNERVGGINVNEPTECETEEAKQVRETEESEALARMLMAEEAQQSFSMQYEFMQSSTADMDTGSIMFVNNFSFLVLILFFH